MAKSTSTYNIPLLEAGLAESTKRRNLNILILKSTIAIILCLVLLFTTLRIYSPHVYGGEYPVMGLDRRQINNDGPPPDGTFDGGSGGDPGSGTDGNTGSGLPPGNINIGINGAGTTTPPGVGGGGETTVQQQPSISTVVRVVTQEPSTRQVTVTRQVQGSPSVRTVGVTVTQKASPQAPPPAVTVHVTDAPPPQAPPPVDTPSPTPSFVAPAPSDQGVVPAVVPTTSFITLFTTPPDPTPTQSLHVGSSPSPTVSDLPNQSSSSTPKPAAAGKKKSPVGLVVGAIIGVLGLACIVGGLVAFYVIRPREKRDNDSMSGDPLVAGAIKEKKPKRKPVPKKKTDGSGQSYESLPPQHGQGSAGGLYPPGVSAGYGAHYSPGDGAAAGVGYQYASPSHGAGAHPHTSAGMAAPGAYYSPSGGTGSHPTTSSGTGPGAYYSPSGGNGAHATPSAGPQYSQSYSGAGAHPAVSSGLGGQYQGGGNAFTAELDSTQRPAPQALGVELDSTSVTRLELVGARRTVREIPGRSAELDTPHTLSLVSDASGSRYSIASDGTPMETAVYQPTYSHGTGAHPVSSGVALPPGGYHSSISQGTGAHPSTSGTAGASFYRQPGGSSSGTAAGMYQPSSSQGAGAHPSTSSGAAGASYRGITTGGDGRYESGGVGVAVTTSPATDRRQSDILAQQLLQMSPTSPQSSERRWESQERR